jgi:hypothetical protein
MEEEEKEEREKERERESAVDGDEKDDSDKTKQRPFGASETFKKRLAPGVIRDPLDMLTYA